MSEIEKYDDQDNFLKAFEDLRPEYFLPEGWDKTKIDRVKELTKPSRTKTAMVASIPMQCKGAKCVFADTCPLQKENIAPIDKPCAIEMAMVVQLMDSYMKQLDVDPSDMVEVSLIRVLVDQEVQYLRKTKYLAKESFIQENIIGIDNNGEPVMKKELHLAVDLEDRVLKRQERILKQLLATREQKAKVGQGILDNAQMISSVLEQQRQFELDRRKALNKALGIYEHDDYIDGEVIEDNSKES